MKYRREIDGMRAIAVGSVMLFHAGLGILAGGFLGVDIFFVISGFLITRIILDELEAGRFSIVNFYERRIRRIIPALVVMMALVTPIAYLIMLPDDLKNFGQSLVATSLSANNVLLYVTSGYFALATEFKPLMHTWSLGVEEQYYLFVPLVMILAFKVWRRKAVFAAIVALSLISFGVCLVLSTRNPDANFYLIFPRIWELGCGALGSILLNRLRSHGTFERFGGMLAAIGLVATVVPMFAFSSAMSLPSWPTAIPVLGTCLVLIYAAPQNAAGRLLATPPFVGLGLISYSVYLYHQPVFVVARLVSLTQPSPRLMTALIVPTLALGWASWRFVERPFRDPRRISRAMVFTLAAITTGLLCAIGGLLHFTSGFYSRWPELSSHDPGFGANQNAAFNMKPFRYKGVVLRRGSGKVNVLVIGNSFARDFINMGLETGALADKAISYSDADDCAYPLPPELQSEARAADFVVLGSGVETRVQDCFLRRIAELSHLTTAYVVVLGTKGFGWNNNAIMLLPPAQRYAFRARPLDSELKYNADAKRVIPASIYVDIFGMISDPQGRVPVFTPDHRFISQDRRHLTQAGAKYIGGIVFQHPVLKLFVGARPSSR
jgi:peptidoglycan/LPS O-acetylase OafA/YrhL